MPSSPLVPVTRHWAPLVAALMLSVASGCDEDGSDDETAAEETSGDEAPVDDENCSTMTDVDTYAVGLRREGVMQKLAFEFVDAVPSPPARFTNTWRIQLTDLATEEVYPGADLDLDLWMPAHQHGSPTPVTVMEVESGIYELGINLNMKGTWESTFRVTFDDDSEDSAMFTFCVE